MQKDDKLIVLSGMRPTGRLHLGNLLGALRHFAAYSRKPEYQCYFFVADWHALTTMDRDDLPRIHENIPNMVLDYLAAGVDPDTSTIYVQSSIPETQELAWYLSCITPFGDLQRIPTFKDKAAKQPENVNAGLLNYPILMAADILGVKADLVPVGIDQKPHLEMTADLARRFNSVFKDKQRIFPVPRGIEEKMIKVPGLDGTGKMGKSDGNTINLDDPPDVIRKKILKAVTDPARKLRTDPGTPEFCKLYSLHQLMSSEAEIVACAEGCRTATIGCGDCKSILSKNVVDHLVPIQERRAELVVNPDTVRDVLSSGNQKIRRVVQATVEEVRETIGLGKRG